MDIRFVFENELVLVIKLTNYIRIHGIRREGKRPIKAILPECARGKEIHKQVLMALHPKGTLEFDSMIDAMALLAGETPPTLPSA